MNRAGNSIRQGLHRMHAMPTEASIYHALSEGRSIESIAAQAGMGKNSLRVFIQSRLPSWKKRPPRSLLDDERRIVVTREAYIGNAYRLVSISLPRISMHEAALADVRGHNHGSTAR